MERKRVGWSMKFLGGEGERVKSIIVLLYTNQIIKSILCPCQWCPSCDQYSIAALVHIGPLRSRDIHQDQQS